MTEFADVKTKYLRDNSSVALARSGFRTGDIIVR
jgi:hypothetical protein